MYEQQAVFLVGLAVLLLDTSYGLVCYNCTAVSNITECNVTANCQTGESCYLQQTHGPSGLQISLGCQSFQSCGGGSLSSGANLVGRDTQRQHVNTRQASSPGCHECCSHDYCNLDLCSHPKPSACVDNESIDCPHLSSLFNICSDIAHAKSVCPNFCGLCNLVDGLWSKWTTWSSCDVTCSNGTRTRTRTCTNPAPSNGGSDCAGTNRETTPCTKPKCPVHGGWSLWSPWGECSVTCDVGIQRRDRTCSNPYPDLYGDHCFGESRDDRICMNNTCTVDIVGFHVNHVREFISNVPVFDQVLLNEGGGYNTSTGYFTAPSAGMYRFTAAMCATLNSHFYFGITKGPSSKFSWLTSKDIYARYSYSCGESSAITRLSVGEQVSVRVVNGYTSSHYQNSVIISTFTGTKVSP